ncbi:hypothetical protein JKF63_03551 [Porcisia hertigi]|uniref:Leucine rich repeat protein n=1 Tax=Porcisia hertigi TaxID=2761500 RepID=A0A836IQW6_9TRYP|nr:hypothetical protein JKF63_03551 [Porcisia hertigi]
MAAASLQCGGRATRNKTAPFSVTQSPHIHEKAWFFHTTLLSSIQMPASDDNGRRQPGRSGDVQEQDASLPEQQDVAPVVSPHSDREATNSSPAEPEVSLSLESNRLFFADASFSSDTGASLVDRYSLHALYASRSVSLGMRRPFPPFLEQLPTEAGQEAANRLRMLVARDTYIPAKACQALTVLLPYCRTLEYIDLRNAGLRSKSGCVTGVNALLDALLLGAGHHSIGAALHTIDVSFNELNDRTGVRLLRLAQQQPCLRVVNTEGTNISEKVKMRIAEEVAKNSEKYTRLMVNQSSK